MRSAVLISFLLTGIQLACSGYIAQALMDNYHASILPYYYFIQTIVFGATIVFSYFMSKKHSMGYAFAFFALSALFVCAVFVLVIAIGDWGFFIAAVVLQTALGQSFIVFGTTVARAFNIREYRKVTNDIITAAAVSGIFFSLLLPLMINIFSSVVLLVISGISFGIIFFYIRNLTPLSEIKKKTQESVETVMPAFYFPLLSYAVIIMIILVLLDYLYMVNLKSHFSGDMISIVSTLFTGGVFFLVIIFQIFFQKRFFLQFGITGAFLFYPLCITLLAAVALISPSLSTILFAYGIVLASFTGPYMAAEETLFGSISSNLQNRARSHFMLAIMILGKAILASLILFLLGDQFATSQNLNLIIIVFSVFALCLWILIKKGHHDTLREKVEQTRFFLFQPRYSQVDLGSKRTTDMVADAKAIAFRALRSGVREPLHNLEDALRAEGSKTSSLLTMLQLEPREHMKLELWSRYQISLQRFLYIFAAVSDTRAVLNTIPKIQVQMFAKWDESDKAFAIEYLDTISDNPALRSLLQETLESAHSPTPVTYADDPWLTRVSQIETFVPGANMNINERVLFLRRVHLFESLSAEGLEVIAEALTEFIFKAGEEVFHQGEDAERVLMVVHGQVEIGTDERKLDKISQYGLFGELAFLDDKPRSATCKAVTEVLLLGLDKADFYQLLEDIPDLSKAVIRQLMLYLRKSDLFRV